MKLAKEKVGAVLAFFKPTIIAVATAAVLFLFVFGWAYVPTSSMANTIPENSLTFILRTRFLFGGLHRGDIIVFQPESDNTQPTGDEQAENRNLPLLAKRIVGLPGDIVEIKGGATYINGELYEEPWLAEKPEPMDFGPYEVDEGQLFVMGDNRNHSIDSRYWRNPLVSEDAVIGRILFVAA